MARSNAEPLNSSQLLTVMTEFYVHNRNSFG